MSIYSETLEKQKEFFRSGATLPYDHRISKLRALRDALKRNEESLLEALHADLGKSPFEGYATELGIVYEEIAYLEKHLRKLMKPTKAKTPITQFRSRSYVLHEPMGQVLIMSPWNYPLQLTMVPLCGAIAGGRTRPLLSPWVIMMPPIIRVETPQEVWWQYLSLLSRSRY